MIKSMTGYGKVNVSNDRYELEIELRSVNSRYLDLKIHAPREINSLENEIRNTVSQFITRGKVDLMIRLKDYYPPQLELDKERLKAFWQLYKEASDVVSSDEPISLKQIMSEKSIINIKETDDDTLLKFLQIHLKTTLEEHKKMAYLEGESMQISMLNSTEICLNSLKNIEKSIPDHKKNIFERMQQNVETLLDGKLDDNGIKRLMLEISLYVEKSDITEELVRLRDHLEKFSNTLLSNKIDVGKTLNFILQEMHREINTIGSKFSTKESYDHILRVKEEIEKCREMVQNVE